VNKTSIEIPDESLPPAMVIGRLRREVSIAYEALERIANAEATCKRLHALPPNVQELVQMARQALSARSCQWCAEGKPEWSKDARVWIHRRERLDRRCENPPQPDWSAGDVIAAYEDGTIVLDDGITTWNPERATQFLARRSA
jgi:hypothetical protein